jgi:hypothetical protein
MSANQAESRSPNRRRGLVEMNMEHLEDTTIGSRFQQECTRWRVQEGKYPVMITCWEKYVKWKPRFLFIQEDTAFIRVDMIHKEFYYACIYDILKDLDILAKKHPH